MHNTQISNEHEDVVLELQHTGLVESRTLLSTLLVVDEGMPCTYHMQLPEARLTAAFMETLLDFVEAKDARISRSLPSVPFPQELLDSEEGTILNEHTGRVSRWNKKLIFENNLCAYKYIESLDHFVLLDPSCVILRNGWLLLIHQASLRSTLPYLGPIQRVTLGERQVVCGWSRCGWYNGSMLRSCGLEAALHQRRDNPWWPLREHVRRSELSAVFSEQVLSAFDTPTGNLLHALYWTHATQSTDPAVWGQSQGDVDFPLLRKPGTAQSSAGTEEAAVLCSVAFPPAGQQALRQHYKAAAARSAPLGGERQTAAIKNFPLSGPRHHLLRDNALQFDITYLEDMFVGERCFIIGNGPSLNRTDLTLLKTEYTFGLNRIYLNYEKMGFEPTFLCVANRNVIEQFHHEIDMLNSVKFIDYPMRSFIRNRWNTFFMESYGFHEFNEDLRDQKWCQGVTVTYCAMQVAFYLGFEEVVLLGVDHSFPKAGRPHMLVTEQEEDSNHFHPDYFGKGIKWQYPDLKRSEVSYRVAKRVFEMNGRKIVDATVGGQLTIFPKVRYTDLFPTASGAPA